jgi:hypothetical protein
MNAYEISKTVEPGGQLLLTDVPFAPGTEVEVTVNAKRRSAADFTAEWNRVCAQMRAGAVEISDDDLQREIDDYRAGK